MKEKYMSLLKKIVIDGKFLTEKLTGIQRFAVEITAELDKMVCVGDEIELLVPESLKNIPEYKNIKIVRYGKLNGLLWQQLCLPFYLYRKRAVCLSFCNIIPVLKPGGFSVIHDISYAVNPDFFTNTHSRLSRYWHMLNYRAACKFNSHIFTVSSFSKSEIIKRYRIKDNKITVAYNAWQHFVREPVDDGLMENFPQLKSKEYFFSMSSIARNKNFNWIVEAAKKNPDYTFAVAGYFNAKKYGEDYNLNNTENIYFLGYVNDGEAKALMKNCKAFLFPTLYEGFGIPPLEAMSVGARAVVSDIPCLREVYEDSVWYINPYSYETDLYRLLEKETAPSKQTLSKYSWQKSASEIYKILFYK